MTPTDAAGRTELHYAALANDVSAADARLSAGDDPNQTDEEGFTALHFAAQERAVDVARLLLDRGADVDAVNSYGNTPLFTSSSTRREMVRLLSCFARPGRTLCERTWSDQTPVGLARLIDNYDAARFFADLR